MTIFQNTLVIGGGMWGENYIKQLGRNCVAVVDKNLDRLAYLRDTYGVKVFLSVEEFNNHYASVYDVSYEHVIIATPPENHIPYAHHFCVEGKYVLIEKPLCEKEEYGHALYRFPEQIMMGHIYTYNPGIIALKEKLKTFAAHHIYCRRTNKGPVRQWQNALWDLAPHDISICNFLLDQTPLNYDIIDKYDYGIIELEYIACSAVIYVSWLGGPKVRQVELVPANNGERVIFDDLKQVTEVSPMRLMLNAFYQHDWNKWCNLQAGLDIIKILENTQSHEFLLEDSRGMEFIK